MSVYSWQKFGVAGSFRIGTETASCSLMSGGGLQADALARASAEAARDAALRLDRVLSSRIDSFHTPSSTRTRGMAASAPARHGFEGNDLRRRVIGTGPHQRTVVAHRACSGDNEDPTVSWRKRMRRYTADLFDISVAKADKDLRFTCRAEASPTQNLMLSTPSILKSPALPDTRGFVDGHSTQPLFDALEIYREDASTLWHAFCRQLRSAWTSWQTFTVTQTASAAIRHKVSMVRMRHPSMARTLRTWVSHTLELARLR